MRKINKHISLVLLILIIFSLVGCAEKPPETDNVIELSIYHTAEYLKDEVKSLEHKEELSVIALLRSNNISYYDNSAKGYNEDISNIVANMTDTISAEDYINVILASTSTGNYAQTILLDNISYDSDLLRGGYLNKVRALIAFESGNYIPSDDGDVTIDGLVEFILSLQMEDGSFQYKGMEETPIEVTANAVIALALTNETPEITAAIDNGVDYLSTRIRQDDTIKDLALTVMAINATENDASNVEGNDLIAWILSYQREDCSYNKENPEDKNGNIDDTSYALMALTSQFRYQHDMYSIFDMNDVLDDSINNPKTVYLLAFVVPTWAVNYINIAFAILALIILVLILRFKRIKKLREEGIYNETEDRKMTDEEIVEQDIQEAKLENERENK